MTLATTAPAQARLRRRYCLVSRRTAPGMPARPGERERVAGGDVLPHARVRSHRSAGSSSGRLIGPNIRSGLDGEADTGPRTFSGVYTINADCTGSKAITINGQPSHYALIMVDRGREIETAETDAGTLLAFTQVRQ
jgi:hypothetical protein